MVHSNCLNEYLSSQFSEVFVCKKIFFVDLFCNLKSKRQIMGSYIHNIDFLSKKLHQLLWIVLCQNLLLFIVFMIIAPTKTCLSRTYKLSLQFLFTNYYNDCYIFQQVYMHQIIVQSLQILWHILHIQQVYVIFQQVIYSRFMSYFLFPCTYIQST